MKHLIVLLYLLNSAIWAQVSYSGKIVDAKSQKALPRAGITLLETGRVILCDDEGKFTFVSDGKNFQMNVTFIGYQTLKLHSSMLTENKENIIPLEQKLLASQTILVTAALQPSELKSPNYAGFSREEIVKNYTIQDVPEYLASLPSTTFYSESGNGVGYNYISIRGFDQRRISVAINGIPQNDPEDHNVYWLDFPDIMANSEYIQVQRGAGNGVIGYPSIGGAINIITNTFNAEPHMKFSAGMGSFNTRKYSADYSSGTINGKYNLNFRISRLMSDGYRKSSWSAFNSLYISALKYDENFTTQINLFGGSISDGLAYMGLPKDYMKDKELRRLNYSDWYYNSDNKPDYMVCRRAEEIENFTQPHFEILNEFVLNDDIKFNSALFLVLGQGFFDYDAYWADTTYLRLLAGNGFTPKETPSGTLIRAQVENRQYGWIPRVSIKHRGGELSMGAELRIHRSLHWGSISYAAKLPEGVDKNYRYYQYNGSKDVINAFVNENYEFSENLNLLGEMQFAYHEYRIYNEKYLNNEFTVDGFFINPRLSLNYKISDNSDIYLSLARVTREPRLKNYYDAAESSGGETPQFGLDATGKYDYNQPHVKPEVMTDLELGSALNWGNLRLTGNMFYMSFSDEIVKKGSVDKFGQPITGNMEKTVHLGLEFTGNLRLAEHLDILLNATFSRNKIDQGSAFIKYKKEGKKTVGELKLDGNRIAGFPDFLCNALINFNSGKFLASINARYVGKSYSDNYDSKLGTYLTEYPNFNEYKDNVIDGYFNMDLFVSYNFSVNYYLQEMKIFLQCNNVFNSLHANYAIGKEFYPNAQRNFFGGIEIGL